MYINAFEWRRFRKINMVFKFRTYAVLIKLTLTKACFAVYFLLNTAKFYYSNLKTSVIFY